MLNHGMLCVSTGLATMVLLAGAPAIHAESVSFCNAYARDFARLENGPADRVVGGAVLGSSGSALLGGSRNSIGAGVAPMTGGGSPVASGRTQRDYNYAFERCRYGGIGAAYSVVPPRGTPEWIDYCSAKYRSFDRATGRFLSFSGKWKPCR